jgi:hypothetical protein
MRPTFWCSLTFNYIHPFPFTSEPLLSKHLKITNKSDHPPPFSLRYRDICVYIYNMFLPRLGDHLRASSNCSSAWWLWCSGRPKRWMACGFPYVDESVSQNSSWMGQCCTSTQTTGWAGDVCPSQSTDKEPELKCSGGNSRLIAFFYDIMLMISETFSSLIWFLSLKLLLMVGLWLW